MAGNLTRGWNDWCQHLARGLNSNLTSALGANTKVECQGTNLVPDIDVRADMPSDAAGIFSSISDGVASILIDDKSSIRLANLVLGKSPEDVEARIGTDEKINEDEQAAIREIGAKMAAALTAAASSVTAGPPAWGEVAVAFLVDSTWDDEKDRLPSGQILRAHLALSAEQGEEIKFDVVIDESLAKRAFPLLAEYIDIESIDLDAPRKVLSLVGEEMKASLEGWLDESDSCEPSESVVEFLQRFEDEQYNVGVVEIKNGDETWLPLLGDLRSRARKPLLILLEEPKTWRVVQCGRLGLFGVLGGGCTQREFNRRIRDERLQPMS